MLQRILRLPRPGRETFFLIEAKASGKLTSDHLSGLRQLHTDQPKVARRIVVCLESKRRKTEDGIEVLPAVEFAKELASGEILGR